MAKDNKREMMRQKLRERQNRERKTGGNFKAWIEFPEEIPIWKPEAGDHVINILEFEMGDKDPCIKKYDKGSIFNEGDLTHMLEVAVHRNVGASKDSYVCLKQYGKPCPICEHRDSLWEEDRDQAKKLYPSIRCVYNILSMYPDEDQEKGVMVWDVAPVYMEDEIQPLARMPMRNPIEGIDPNPVIADPSMEFGREISFNIGKKTVTINGKPTSIPDYTAHRLDIRNYDIPDDILDQVHHRLDQYIVISSYDEIYEAYWGESKKKVAREEIQENKISTKKPLINRELNNKREVIDDDIDDSVFKDDDNELDCPHDHIFGEDCGNSKYAEDCDDCDVFEDCAIAKRELRKKVKEQKEKEPEEVKEVKKTTTIIKRRGR